MFGLNAQNVKLNSSVDDVDRALREAGVFRYSHEYVKDKHFERYVITPNVTDLDQAREFLRMLDRDNSELGYSGCLKAFRVRNWIANRSHDSIIGELEWAVIGLSKARRTCCSCHEIGSFKRSARTALHS